LYVFISARNTTRFTTRYTQRDLESFPEDIWPLVMVLGISACGDNSQLTNEAQDAVSALNDTWETDCLVNPTLNVDPDEPIGYFRETLRITTFTGTQTIEYFQDAACTVPVTESQVANENETLFLQNQSQVFSVSYPPGETETDLGTGFFLDLQEISVSIDDTELSEDELEEQDITLDDLLGLFVITESETLHLSTSSTDERPTTVPLDFFYTRSGG